VYIGSNHGAALHIQGSGETLASFADDGAVTLYHDSNPKLATTATGIDVTGKISLNSGSGIDFSATPGTGTSELFQDYEERYIDSYGYRLHDSWNSYICLSA
jgi:hypothetical protein